MVVWLHGGVFLLRMLVRNLCLGFLLCLALPALAAEEVRVGAYHFPPYMVKPESAEPVGLVQPFGDIGKALAGMAVVPGGVLALDPESNSLHRYQRGEEGWQAQPVLPLGKLNEPQGLSVRAVVGGGA